VDVDAWLESLPPRALDCWIAFDAVEPIGEQWMQSAQICGLLSQVIGVIAATNGVKLDSQTMQDFMPSRFEMPPKTKQSKTSKKNQKVVEFNAVAAKLGLGVVVNGNNNKRG
jgi:hypothetical protein